MREVRRSLPGGPARPRTAATESSQAWKKQLPSAKDTILLCGDGCTVYLGVSEGIIKDMSVEGAGCAIMLASASLMTLAVSGKTLEQASEIAEQFMTLVTTETCHWMMRPRRPGCTGWRAGLSGPGEVRHAAVACPAGGDYPCVEATRATR